MSELNCIRCGNTWTPRKVDLPKRCPRCQNPTWNTPYKRKRDRLVPRIYDDVEPVHPEKMDESVVASDENATISAERESDKFVEKKRKAEELLRMLGGS